MEQPENIPVDIEKIQNLVEQQLMLNQVPDVAKAYILYRHSQEQKRKNDEVDHSIAIKEAKGVKFDLSIASIESSLNNASSGLDIDTLKLARKKMR